MNQTSPITFGDIDKLLTSDRVGFMVSTLPRRVGALSFIVFLEYRHFIPDTPRNDLFRLIMINWEGFQMALSIIPKEDETTAVNLMKTVGLRKSDGVPIVITGKGTAIFPLDRPNLFTLENVSGHFVYENNLEKMKLALEAEDIAIAEEFKKFERKNGPDTRRS